MPGRRTPAVVLSPEGGALTVPATLNCTSSWYNVGGRIRPIAVTRCVLVAFESGRTRPKHNARMSTPHVG